MRKDENSKCKDLENQIKIHSKVTELSDDAIITKSRDGIITSWNRGAERIYGYSAKEVLGKPISILEPPTLFEESKELIELIEYEESIHHFETLRLRKDGKLINVSLTLSPILDDSENLIAILVIARDITESKLSEENLQRIEEMYRIVIGQTGQVIYNYDLRADKCSWAGAIEEVTGYSFEELQILGKYVWITRIFPLEGSGILKPLERRNLGDRFSEEGLVTASLSPGAKWMVPKFESALYLLFSTSKKSGFSEYFSLYSSSFVKILSDSVDLLCSS